MRECDDEQQVFVVDLLIISSESVNGSVQESGPLRIECNHVMIKKKLRGDQHWIVILKKASDEVCCYTEWSPARLEVAGVGRRVPQFHKLASYINS